MLRQHLPPPGGPQQTTFRLADSTVAAFVAPAAAAAAAGAGHGVDAAMIVDGANPDAASEYILQCERMAGGDTLALSISTHVVKLYDRATLKCGSVLSGAHADTITDMHASTVTPHALWTSSVDRTLRLWDCRSAANVQVLALPDTEVWACTAGVGDALIAAGLEDGRVCFFDPRMIPDAAAAAAGATLGAGGMVGEYTQCHTDAVTQLQFHPTQATHLVTGSLDGLACLFDVAVRGEDDALQGVMNVESSVNQIGFAGAGADQIFCLTSTETLQIWELQGCTRLATFADPRGDVTRQMAVDAAAAASSSSSSSSSSSAAAGGAGGAGGAGEAAGYAGVAAGSFGMVAEAGQDVPALAVDYLVGGHYDTGSNELYVLGGSQDGSLMALSVTPGGLRCVARWVDRRKGHRAGIRCFDWQEMAAAAAAGGGAGSSSAGSAAGAGRHTFTHIVTGGEDGRLCHWTTAPAPPAAAAALATGVSASTAFSAAAPPFLPASAGSMLGLGAGGFGGDDDNGDGEDEPGASGKADRRAQRKKAATFAPY
eukprot:g4641.t1